MHKIGGAFLIFLNLGRGELFPVSGGSIKVPASASLSRLQCESTKGRLQYIGIRSPVAPVNRHPCSGGSGALASLLRRSHAADGNHPSGRKTEGRHERQRNIPSRHETMFRNQRNGQICVILACIAFSRSQRYNYHDGGQESIIGHFRASTFVERRSEDGNSGFFEARRPEVSAT